MGIHNDWPTIPQSVASWIPAPLWQPVNPVSTTRASQWDLVNFCDVWWSSKDFGHFFETMMINHDWLVVEPTPLKNIKVNWDDYSQYMEKKMFQTTNQMRFYGGANLVSKTHAFSGSFHAANWNDSILCRCIITNHQSKWAIFQSCSQETKRIIPGGIKQMLKMFKDWCKWYRYKKYYFLSSKTVGIMGFQYILWRCWLDFVFFFMRKPLVTPWFLHHKFLGS